MDALYADRASAGRALAAALLRNELASGAVVLGLSRGGVPVAAEVAVALGVPLDVLVVRKLGVPGHEELAMGAVAAGDVRVLDERVVREAGVDDEAIAEVTRRELEEVERQGAVFRGDRPPLELRDAPAILVDDGLATGSTMRAAVQAVRAMEAASVIVAVPVGSAQAVDLLTGEADAVVCPEVPDPFVAVGAWYERFEAVGDAEVRRLLGAQR
ncbi:MAG: phosphoribosyltransferase [Actinomycetota bacterium]|nr:phosphoribosyltransferase [Actinomycetota bacterium]